MASQKRTDYRPRRGLGLLLAIGLVVLGAASAGASRHFPSARWWLYMPSSEGNVSAAGAQWEAENVDLFVVEPGPKRKVHNPTAPFYRYEVMQYLHYLGRTPWAWLQRYAEDHGLDFEDFFEHLSEDTVFRRIGEDTYGGTDWWRYHARFAAVYIAAGGGFTERTHQAYTNDYGSGNYTFCQSVGDALYIGHRDKFQALNIGLGVARSDDWNGVWEYCSAAAADGTPLAWSALPIQSDGTNGLRQSGKIEFGTPPTWWSSWKISAPYVAGWIDEPQLGGGRLYFVRVRCTAQGGTAPAFRDGGQTPGGVKLDKYLIDVGAYSGTERKYRYPGWDAANDPDGDGFAERVWQGSPANPNATALLRAHARYPIRVQNPSTGFATYMGSAAFRSTFAEHCRAMTQASFGGYTFDGMFMDEAEPKWHELSKYWLLSGGGSIEYPNPNTAPDEYRADMAAALGAAQSSLGAIGKAIGGNHGAGSYPDVMDNSDFAMHGEFFLYVSSSWYTFVDRYPRYDYGHAAGASKLFQFQNVFFPDWGDTWLKRGNYFGLATFYLYQNWALDYGAVWYGSTYGSGTDAEKSKRYFPDAIQADIGTPTGVVPAGKTVPGQFNNGTYIFAEPTNPVTGRSTPIYAREYTKGLVLVRFRHESDPSSTQSTYGDGSASSVNLGDTYYPVQYDGTLGAAATQISLRVGDAAILVKANPSATPTITFSPDRIEGPPGAVITYTVRIENTQSAAIISDPWADVHEDTDFLDASDNGIYDSETRKVVWPLVTLQPGEIRTVTFRATIR